MVKKLLLLLSLIAFVAYAMDTNENTNVLVNIEEEESPSDQVLLCRLSPLTKYILDEIKKGGSLKKWENPGPHAFPFGGENSVNPIKNPLSPRQRKSIKIAYQAMKENRVIHTLKLPSFNKGKGSLLMIRHIANKDRVQKYLPKMNINTQEDAFQIMEKNEALQTMFDITKEYCRETQSRAISAKVFWTICAVLCSGISIIEGAILFG